MEWSSITRLDLTGIIMHVSEMETLVQGILECSLTHLKIACCDVNYGSFWLGRLGESTSLECLNLAENALSAYNFFVMMTRLAACRSLRYLDLSHNEMGIEMSYGLVFLPQFRSISFLKISGCRLTDEGLVRVAPYFHHCPFLAHLDLSGNGIKYEGIRTLASVLHVCKALAHLVLRANEIQAVGLQHLVQALGNAASLRHVNLRDNQLGAEGVEKLARAMQEKSASIKHRNFGNDENCSSLICLDLQDNKIGAEAVETLEALISQCTSVFFLKLQGNVLF